MPERKKIIEISQNKKAFHDYEILDSIEAGIELKGTEIKSIRDHSVNLKDSFVIIKNGEALLYNLHISPYGFGNIFNHEAMRTRKLLLHKKEILKLSILTSQKGITLIPTKIYIKGKYAKIMLGIAKGKKIYEKKAALKERDIKRDMDREMGSR
jgi:SsrA-binding protein